MTLDNIIRTASLVMALSNAHAKLARPEQTSTAFYEQLNQYASGVQKDVIEVANTLVKSVKSKKSNLEIYTKEIDLPESSEKEAVLGVSVPVQDSTFNFEIHKSPEQEHQFIVLEVFSKKGKRTQKFIDYFVYGSVDHGESTINGRFEYDVPAMQVRDADTGEIDKMKPSQLDLIERTYGSCIRTVRDYVRKNK